MHRCGFGREGRGRSGFGTPVHTIHIQIRIPRLVVVRAYEMMPRVGVGHRVRVSVRPSFAVGLVHDKAHVVGVGTVRTHDELTVL